MVLQLKCNAVGGQLRHNGLLAYYNVCGGFTKKEMCALSTRVEECILVKLQHFLCLWPFLLGARDRLFFKTFQIHWPHNGIVLFFIGLKDFEALLSIRPLNDQLQSPSSRNFLVKETTSYMYWQKIVWTRSFCFMNLPSLLCVSIVIYSIRMHHFCVLKPC